MMRKPYVECVAGLRVRPEELDSVDMVRVHKETNVLCGGRLQITPVSVGRKGCLALWPQQFSHKHVLLSYVRAYGLLSESGGVEDTEEGDKVDDATEGASTLGAMGEKNDHKNQCRHKGEVVLPKPNAHPAFCVHSEREQAKAQQTSHKGT